MRLIFVALLLLISISTSAEEQTVLFWHHYADAERAAFWENLVEEFNDTNPYGITVSIQYYPSYNNQHDAILSGLLNGQIPNVSLVRNHHAALYQLSNSLVDLTSYVEDSETDFGTPPIYKLMWEQDIINGQRLGIPLTRAYEALYINMDLLRDFGYEAPPQTRDELAEIACHYAEEKGYTAVGFEIPLSASFFLALNDPIEFYDGQNFDVDLSETLFFLQNLLTKRCVSLNIGTVTEAQNRFASGQTLFYIDSSAAKPYVTDAISSFFAEPFALELLPIPAKDKLVLNWYGESLVVFHKDEAQDLAAWHFVEWLAKPQQIGRWAKASGGFPVHEDVDWVESEYFWRADWMTEPNMAGYDLIRDEIVFAVRELLGGGVEMQPRLQALNQTINEIKQVFNE